jgi:hypothetical protein
MDDKEYYEAAASTPSAWLSQAVGLLRAAYVVWMKFDEHFQRMFAGEPGPRVLAPEEIADSQTDRFYQVYMMLAGLAIENTIKGLLISQQSLKVQDGKLPRILRKHCLERYFQRVGIQIDKGESRLLRVLTEAIEWKGRYSVPTGLDKLRPEFPGSSLSAFASVLQLPQTVTRLFKKVAEQYPEFTPRPLDKKTLLSLLEMECPKKLLGRTL